jgi:D-amino-acid dehydrogenase
MSAQSTSAMPAVVVGAGIVGAAIAFELQRRGRSVILVDRDEPGRGCSFGNMGSVATTEFLPASRPAIWAQIPKWVLDPNGPVKVRASYLPRLLPWLLRFLLAGRRSQLRALEDAGAALCARVHDDLTELLSAAGLSRMLSAAGCLCLYASESELRSDREHLEVIRRYGIPHETVGREQIAQLEPALSPKIKRAVLFPGNRTIADPHGLVVALVECFRRLGGILQKRTVVALERTVEGRIARLRLADGKYLDAGIVVVAAGAFTAALSQSVGERMPLETERGYHTQIMDPGVTLRHSLLWPARAFMVSPIAGGIRVGGTVELAGLDEPPDYRRARTIAQRAREVLPGLQVKEASEWMGHRPALPDTLPIIGPSARVGGVYYATGHGHLGLTYAATTARIIADLISARSPSVDLTPYRVNRFGWSVNA